jgi:hypothetical protein
VGIAEAMVANAAATEMKMKRNESIFKVVERNHKKNIRCRVEAEWELYRLW